MRRLYIFTHSFFLAITPVLLTYPEQIYPQIIFSMQQNPVQERRTVLNYTSYDGILQLLEEIESGECETKYSAEELQQISGFITFLAREGLLPDGSEEMLSLEHDAAEMLADMSLPYQPARSFGLCNGYYVHPRTLA